MVHTVLMSWFWFGWWIDWTRMDKNAFWLAQWSWIKINQAIRSFTMARYIPVYGNIAWWKKLLIVLSMAMIGLTACVSNGTRSVGADAIGRTIPERISDSSIDLPARRICNHSGCQSKYSAYWYCRVFAESFIGWQKYPVNRLRLKLGVRLTRDEMWKSL